MLYTRSDILPWYIHRIRLQHILLLHSMHVVDYWRVHNTRYAYHQLMMIDDGCYLWYEPIIHHKRMSLMYDAWDSCLLNTIEKNIKRLSDWCMLSDDITQYMILIQDAYRTYCKLLLYGTFVIDLWYMSTTDNASYDCCRSMPHNCHNVDEWCVLIVLSFYDTYSTCYRSMHIATMRYCIVWGPLIWGPSIWGYGDHRYHSLSAYCDSPGVLRIRFKA